MANSTSSPILCRLLFFVLIVLSATSHMSSANSTCRTTDGKIGEMKLFGNVFGCSVNCPIRCEDNRPPGTATNWHRCLNDGAPSDPICFCCYAKVAMSAAQ